MGARLSSLLPLAELYPCNIPDLAAAYRNAVSGPNSSRNFIGILGIHGRNVIKVAGFTQDENNSLTLATMLLANNQINEACNKFYATVELANAVKERTFSGSIGVSSDHFSGEYVLGALIPVLYYSQVAALLSLFSAYGLLFVRDRRTRQERQPDSELQRLGMQQEYDFLVIRTQNGWSLRSRSQMAGGNRNRFHQQLIAIGNRFFASGTDANGFDFNLIRDLKAKRELADYSILGYVSQRDVMGSFESYMRFLPRAYANIKFCIETISRIDRITNNCDRRIHTLESSALALLFTHPISIQLNLLAQMPSSFVVTTTTSGPV